MASISVENTAISASNGMAGREKATGDVFQPKSNLDLIPVSAFLPLIGYGMVCVVAEGVWKKAWCGLVCRLGREEDTSKSTRTAESCGQA